MRRHMRTPAHQPLYLVSHPVWSPQKQQTPQGNAHHVVRKAQLASVEPLYLGTACWKRKDGQLRVVLPGRMQAAPFWTHV